MSGPQYELVQQLEEVHVGEDVVGDHDDIESDAPLPAAVVSASAKEGSCVVEGFPRHDDDDNNDRANNGNTVYYDELQNNIWYEKFRMICRITVPTVLLLFLLLLLVGYSHSYSSENAGGVGGGHDVPMDGLAIDNHHINKDDPMDSTTTTTTITTTPASSSSSSTTTLTFDKDGTPIDLPTTTWKLKQQLDSCRNDADQRCFMFSMKDSGLGSQLINMFVNRIYLHRVYGYTTMLVDCMAYEGYRRPDGEPVLSGYFTIPDVAVLNYHSELDRYVQPLLPSHFNLSYYDTLDYKNRKGRTYKDMVVHPTAAEGTDLVVVSHMMFHSVMRNWVKDSGFGGYRALYRTLVQTMCPQLQFKSNIREEMLHLRREQYPNLPDDLIQSNDNDNDSNTNNDRNVSLAFHVRRTDKLTSGESEFYHSDVYVRKAARVLESDGIATGQVSVCFLATDDNAVHAEMDQALIRAGFTCRLVYTHKKTPAQTTYANNDNNGTDITNITPVVLNHGNLSERYKPNAGMIFLTEFGVLLEATYLVGTFGSNVDALAAVLRACPGRYDAEKNYAQTYGVDRPNWYFR